MRILYSCAVAILVLIVPELVVGVAASLTLWHFGKKAGLV